MGKRLKRLDSKDFRIVAEVLRGNKHPIVKYRAVCVTYRIPE